MGIILLAIVVAVLAVVYRNYIQSNYYLVTKKSPLQVYLDKGKLGEYMTYKYLRSAEKNGAKFLFNIYIPTGEGETTEIDVLMIHAKGLFVFESKNYSGWIFGNEYQKNWYQTLPQGRGHSRKEAFYNPIMQNRTHIKHLRSLVGESVPIHSVITFSERCTLKNVEVSNNDVCVIKRDKVYETVVMLCSQNENTILNADRIAEIYEKLYPYTQVSAETKQEHIHSIEEMTKSASAQSVLKNAAESDPVAGKICPRCGSKLVLRTASRGANVGNQFFGCTSYPKCRYTEPVDSK